MSLVCHECNVDIQPGKSFPGREGVLVSPTVVSLLYTPKSLEGNNIVYALGYTQSGENRSLCFECIQGGLSHDKINPVYLCLEAEESYKKIQEKQSGKMIPISECSKTEDAFNKYRRLQERLRETCIYCNSNVENGKPYFHANAIDRLASSKHTTFFGSYSFSNLERAMTSFNICYDDFKKHFPKSFEQLAFDLIGGENPKNKGSFELYVDPEIEREIKKQTGKTLVEILSGRTKK